MSEEELRNERDRIAFLYEKLDEERRLAAVALDKALRDPHEQRWHREVAVETLSAQAGRLRVADVGLCFGRTDHTDGGRTYIGRVGLFDQEADYEPLLTDWRAPVARSFYCATSANPEGLTRRRHFHTSGRELVDFHDDELQLDGTTLLAALNAPREETMRDIVATIRADQDEIIRLGHRGVVVIEGGPGTGKTAVALHRVAYLLYTQRERLSRQGVLVVGPNAGFLRYIGDVLPSLGETDVVFAAPGELFPGVRTSVEDRPEIQRLKGSLAILDVLAAAVANRQEVPDQPIPIELEDVTVLLDGAIAATARDRARVTGLPHNEARAVFHRALVDELVPVAVALIGESWSDLVLDVRRELSGSQELLRAVDRLWPVLTPRRVLADLFGSPDRCAAVGRSALYRARGDAWTVSDVPLLDEVAELLGSDGAADRAAERERQERLAYAQGVLDMFDTDMDSEEWEVMRVVDSVDAERLAGRHEERDRRYLAERAEADREWTYGHVVVDEAQELSEMDWRVLMRRCPSRSMTIVGDLAQRESVGGARDWAAVLDRYVPGRWAYRQLTINYRTPAEVMDVAATVLARLDPTAVPPKSVRRDGVRPWARRVDDIEEAIREEWAKPRSGTFAVIAPVGLGLGVPTLTPRQSKGLEFDTVLVVAPALMSPAELYVALTRTTQRLGVLHTAPLGEVEPLLEVIAQG